MTELTNAACGLFHGGGTTPFCRADHCLMIRASALMLVQMTLMPDLINMKDRAKPVDWRPMGANF